MSMFSDLVTCNICFGRYEQPRSLPCLHTFCQDCIQSYMNKRFTENTSKSVGVDCPICRKFTALPNDMSPFEWASHLPHDHRVSTLMELDVYNRTDQKCGRCKDVVQKDCSPQWCHNCLMIVCIQCMPSHKNEHVGHKTTHIKDLQIEKEAVTTRLCIKHTDKPLDIFCVDHSTAICGLCFLNEHRKCDKVEELDIIVRKRRSTENDIADKLKTTRISMEQVRQDQNERDAKFHKKLNEIRREVRLIRNKIDKHLSTLEDNFLEEVATIELENLREVRKEATRSEKLMSQLKQSQTILEKELPTFRGVHYIERHESLSQSSNDLLESVTNSGSSQNKGEAVFTMDDWISKFLTECKSFGKVTTTVSRNNSTDDPKTSTKTPLGETNHTNTKVTFIIKLSAFLSIHDRRVTLSFNT